MSKMATACTVKSVNNLRVFKIPQQEGADSIVRKLENGLVSILNSRQPNQSLQELYTIIENLHSSHRGVLYEKLQGLLEEALLEILEAVVRECEKMPLLIQFWLRFCSQIVIIKNIFLKCDRSSQNSNKYNTVQQLSMNLFKTLIVMSPQIKNEVTKEILQWIEMQRKEITIDLNQLQNALGMLNELQVYDDIFHTEFLRISHNFYLDEGAHLIDELDVRAYLRHVLARIKEEQEREKDYLKKHTATAVLEIVYKNMIKEHLNKILDKTFQLLYKDVIDEELGILYNLLKKVTLGLKKLEEYFMNYIMNSGNGIVNRPDNDKIMIQELLDFKDKVDVISEKHFNSNEAFSNIIRTAFTKFINNKQNKPAQLLAKYIDAKLRAKDLTEDQLEIILGKVMVLFRYIQGKDIFEAFYKKDLAKRLLLGKSTNQDAEDSMIGRLKSECGPAFTSKIEGMFKDINISQGINNAFKQHLVHNLTPNSSDLCINVLTSSFWPNYSTYNVNLPPELVNYQATFQKFYSNNHSGRKLVWQSNLGHCIVKATFDAGNKELQVSLFQTIVLLLFNEAEKLTFAEILELTNIEVDELKRTLFSLACAKNRVLCKMTKGKEIESEDLFGVNTKFTGKLFRVKINQIQLKESVEEQHATEKSVLADRQFQIDAAIVRILKYRKRLNHNELISELFNILDIPVKPYDLKKRIELLIEREYLERDKDDPTNYTYVA
ncbi:unnamed protein product [Acanthoscelides obtectus]|uniref:Cullin family profile domain-containing protein n=1 Tax=Acanthoscelides obtectus TaxID=200917 RepID=A0A9P0KDZ5_ACAOB|nr:unnamed protein product [Acanthoscelides obtectus]CAK1675259.1 Cullin-4A [Acanthoscelides obtectus]